MIPQNNPKIFLSLFQFILVFLIQIFILFCGSDNEDWKKADRITPMSEYSEEDAREWEDIKKEHIPILRKSIHEGKEALLIELPDLVTSPSHYIEKFGIVDLEGKEIYNVSTERTLRPQNYGYVPLELLEARKRYKAFAKCNLHDLWIQEFTLEKLK